MKSGAAKSNILVLLGLPVLLVVSSCKHGEAVQTAGQPANSIQSDSVHRTSTSAVYVDDTNGIGLFVDSLQGDFERGSMGFFLSRLQDGFDGGNEYYCLKDDCVLRKDSAFARGTAQMLGWFLSFGGMEIHRPDGDLMVSGPFVGRPRFFRGSDTLAGPDESSDSVGPGAPDTSVFVGDTTQALFAQVGGEKIGTIQTHWVQKLGSIGGFKPKGFENKIHESWVHIRTPDGREGWTSGLTLRDSKTPSPTMGLVHLREGWRIEILTGANDED